ncbi:hypothetical protein EDM00_06435 [Ornithobacterium rhinotracheale]|uniref:hypothetical protein n=1 Tax=Ornithobacterium rhinotracheale TaxID=28251 RepID=UPI00129D0F93|nr:hypothetical protein [Ornithobacterium rhinotracheale]MRI63626.1 hypothetical protein [Ornithobacterium rhinotracheale]
MRTKHVSDKEKLRKIGVLFTNLTEGSAIATEMAEYGYSTEEIKKGKALYTAAQTLYDSNISENQDEVEAYARFATELEKLNEVYATDRKKARIIYKEQPEVLTNLRLRGRLPYPITSQLEDIKVFYTTLQKEEALRTPLKALKIDEAHLSAQITQLEKTNAAYATYMQEKGENQHATKEKNKALDAVGKWVSKFFSVAKIALEDKPQLLESLAKFIRS